MKSYDHWYRRLTVRIQVYPAIGLSGTPILPGPERKLGYSGGLI